MELVDVERSDEHSLELGSKLPLLIYKSSYLIVREIITLLKWSKKKIPIGSMYGIYANIGGILMVNVTIYSIHGSYGIGSRFPAVPFCSIYIWGCPFSAFDYTPKPRAGASIAHYLAKLGAKPLIIEQSLGSKVLQHAGSYCMNRMNHWWIVTCDAAHVLLGPACIRIRIQCNFIVQYIDYVIVST